MVDAFELCTHRLHVQRQQIRFDWEGHRRVMKCLYDVKHAVTHIIVLFHRAFTILPNRSQSVPSERHP